MVPSATVTIENTSEAQRSLSSYQFRLFAGAEGNYIASTAQVLAPSGEPMTRIALQDEVLFAGEVRKYTIEFGSTFYSAPEGYSPNLRNVRLQVLWSGQSEPVLNVGLATMFSPETWEVPAPLVATGKLITVYDGDSRFDGFPMGRDGDLFMSDRSGNRVHKVDLSSGAITTVAGTGKDGFSGDGGPATSAQVSDPDRLAVDSEGNVFIVDWGNARIRRVDAANGIITTVAKLSHTRGIALDGAGNLFIAESSSNRIHRVDADTGAIITIAGTGEGSDSGDGGLATNAEFRAPWAVAVDGAGNVFIVDRQAARVRRIDAATQIITTVAGTGANGFSGDGGPAANAQLSVPEGIAVDGSGNLFIADTGNNRFRKIDAKTGIIRTVAGSDGQVNCGVGGPATLAAMYPSNVIVDSKNDVFIDAGGFLFKLEIS